MKWAGAAQLARDQGEATGGQPALPVCSRACIFLLPQMLSCRRAQEENTMTCPQKPYRGENMQDGIREDENFIGSSLQQNKPTISLSVSKTLLPERKIFSHVLQTMYYSVVPHQPCSRHLPGLSSVSVPLYILMMSVHTILSV